MAAGLSVLQCRVHRTRSKAGITAFGKVALRFDLALVTTVFRGNLAGNLWLKTRQTQRTVLRTPWVRTRQNRGNTVETTPLETGPNPGNHAGNLGVETTQTVATRVDTDRWSTPVLLLHRLLQRALLQAFLSFSLPLQVPLSVCTELRTNRCAPRFPW